MSCHLAPAYCFGNLRGQCGLLDNRLHISDERLCPWETPAKEKVASRCPGWCSQATVARWQSRWRKTNSKSVVIERKPLEVAVSVENFQILHTDLEGFLECLPGKVAIAQRLHDANCTGVNISSSLITWLRLVRWSPATKRCCGFLSRWAMLPGTHSLPLLWLCLTAIAPLLRLPSVSMAERSLEA